MLETSRPTALPVSPQHIPDDLKALPQWVTWRYVWQKEKWDKPPLKAGTSKAGSSTNAATWSTFAEAWKAYIHGDVDGIGIAVTEANALVGVDIDHCRDPDSGAVAAWARTIVDRLQTYTEVSPSGEGLRLWLKGTRPKKGQRQGHIEVYSWGRYLTMTGCHLDGTPATIEPRQAELEAFEAELTPKPPAKTSHHSTPDNGSGPDLSDDDLLDNARGAKNGRKFERLWAGDISEYSDDDSAADMALCDVLAFWTQDAAQLDRLFRRSGLYRDKWERADYRDATIAKALSQTTEHWTPRRESSNGYYPSSNRADSTPAEEPMKLQPSLTLPQVVEVFQKWLHLPDPGPLYAVLGTYAANLMAGDPLWIMLIGGSGWGKTELLMSLTGLPHVHVASTMTEASLLSGSSRKDKGRDSTGGLLMKIKSFGYLICKDFTSVLSMNREASTTMLAALREIFDGSWTRHVGIDGGRTLSWEGKLSLIAGCTGAIDQYYAIVGALGERFLSYRLRGLEADKQGASALALAGKERQLRAELATAVNGLFAGLTLPEAPPALSEDEQIALVALATLAAHCRSAVIRDRHHRDIELILDSEAPARLALSLFRLYAGMLAIGVTRDEAKPLLMKIALDCMPAIRRAVFGKIIREGYRWKTAELATTLGYPTQTTRRTLEDLTAHKVVVRHKINQADEWTISDDAYSLYSRALKVFPDIYQEDSDGK